MVLTIITSSMDKEDLRKVALDKKMVKAMVVHLIIKWEQDTMAQ